MNFKPELAKRILAGRKTETRRLISDNPRSPWFKERCRLEPGRTYAFCPGRGKNAIGRIRITDLVRCEALGLIDDAGARREGFSNRSAFVAYWQNLYGDFDPKQLVWVVRFALVSESLGVDQ